MNKNGSASKIKLNSIDSLFGNSSISSDIDTVNENIIEIDLNELHGFSNHPFSVIDDDKMEELVESIKEHGVLMPGIARRRVKGGYELISGHRRKRACEIAGLTSMPVFVRDLTDDEAVIVMVDSNIQREEILPSEKAKAYKMKYEAMKHQGRAGGAVTSLAQMSEESGESKTTIQRYIAVADMNDDLLNMVDDKKIGITQAAALSSLSDEEQKELTDVINETGKIPSLNQSAEIKEMSKEGRFEKDAVKGLLENKAPVKKKRSITIKADKIDEYFPEDYTQDDIMALIISLLDEWKDRN